VRGVGLTVERHLAFDDVEADWERLAAAAGHPFASRAWLGAFADELLPPGDVELVGLLRAGTLVALVGFERRGDGVLRFLGDPLSDHAGPFGPPEHAADAMAALPGVVELVLRPGELFVGRGLPAAWTDTLPAGWRCSVDPAPVIDVAGTTWADYLHGRVARRRRRIVAQAERLLERPGVVVRDHTDRTSVSEALAVLIGLHAARFEGRSRTFEGARRLFYERAVPAMAAVGAARIRSLELDGRPAAAILVLTAGDRDWFYQGGWDPAFADLAVGRALFADTVRAAFARGVLAYHLLHGADPYKYFWATSDAPLATITADRFDRASGAQLTSMVTR
jgi:CelD/BcsL family acetyltransferase involved in cellulose biosynthesis